MAKEISSVGGLRRRSEVSDDELAAADAYLKDEITKPFAFEAAHTIDVAKAIELHPQAKKLLADKATTPGLRRAMMVSDVMLNLRSIRVVPLDDSLERWQLGDLDMTPSELWQLAAHYGLVEGDEPQ